MTRDTGESLWLESQAVVSSCRLGTFAFESEHLGQNPALSYGPSDGGSPVQRKTPP